MSLCQVSKQRADEIQALRNMIPYAAKVGAEKTTITIELLAVLLAVYDNALQNMS
jgi:hypothetical protein